MFDDGMVFYINGQEIGRDSMPAGPVSYGTLSYSHEANATYVAGTQSDTYASAFGHTRSSCTSAQLAPYLNGEKRLTFAHNAYRVPSRASARYFMWGGWKSWNEWRAQGHDVDGNLSQ